MTSYAKPLATLVALAVGLTAFAACQPAPSTPTATVAPIATVSTDVPPSPGKKKVLFVDSYHEGYPWSDGIVTGALKTLKITRTADGSLDDSASSVELQLVRMDTKRHQEPAFLQEAGAKVKAVIDTWKPDVVIAADDNASKWVIVPYFKSASLPFVFCGVNWDASAYGFPLPNVTGMLEVSLIPAMLKVLQPYAHGARVGILGANNESNKKEADAYRTKLEVELAEVVFVDDFEAWKTAFVDLQAKVDILLLAPPSFIVGKAEMEAEAKRFVLENTKIPTGAVEDWIAPFALVTFAKRSSEQGEWAAQTALKILAGTSPQQIPIATNQQASIQLNMGLARKLAIQFPVDLIEQSTLVDPE